MERSTIHVLAKRSRSTPARVGVIPPQPVRSASVETPRSAASARIAYSLLRARRTASARNSGG